MGTGTRRMSGASESAPSAAPNAVGASADFVMSSPDTAEQALSSVLAAQQPSDNNHPGNFPSTSVQSSPSSIRRLSRLSMLHQRSSSFQDNDAVAAEPVVSQISVQAESPSDVHSTTSLGRRSTGSARRREALPDLERMSIARLRHQSSSATIRSTNASNEESNDTPGTSSLSSIHAPPSRRNESFERTTGSSGPGAMRQERRKRSALLEQDVSRMRSESRLGNASRTSMTDSSSPEAGRGGGTMSRSSIHTPHSQFEDAGDESSGTEGSGPVVGNRRRKKSSTSSASKRAAARAAQWTKPPELPSVSTAANGNEEAVVRQSGRRGSDGARFYPGTIGRTQAGSSRRSNVHDTFRSDLNSSGGSSSNNNNNNNNNSRRNTITADDKHAWPASGKEGEGDQSVTRGALRIGYRPRRFASDAEAPPSLASETSYSARRNRMTVDASGISRHLGGSVGSRQGIKSGERETLGEDDAMDDALLRSPSEIARQRKISTSSSISHKSSGAASDLHRSASRASLRRALGGHGNGGRDVFDDPASVPSPPPPLPDHSAAFDRSRLTNPMMTTEKSIARSQIGRASTIEELRARLDELTNPQALSVNVLHNPSRSSSRASRARSNVSSTPSTSQTTTSSTSTRQPVGESRRSTTFGHDRSLSEVSPEVKQGTFGGGGMGGTLRRAQAPSRLAEYGSDAISPASTSAASQPRTPYSHASSLHSRRSVSRLANAPSSFVARTPSRFSHSTGPTMETVPRSEQNVPTPLHARNLLNSVDSLQRQLIGSGGGQATVEEGHVADRMREASEAAIDINVSLRSILQTVLTFQIDAEVGRMDEGGSQNAFALLDRDLGVLVRQSDEQVRSLTDGLMALTHLQQATPTAVQQPSPLSHPTQGRMQTYDTAPTMTMSTDSPPMRERSSSRFGVVRPTSTARSPQQERIAATVAAAGSQRRSSLDLRRPTTSTQTNDVGSRTIF